MTTTTPRYLGLTSLRDKGDTHARRARHYARAARQARRDGWPDVAAQLADRAAYHLRVARWMAAGAPRRWDWEGPHYV